MEEPVSLISGYKAVPDSHSSGCLKVWLRQAGWQHLTRLNCNLLVVNATTIPVAERIGLQI